MAKWKLLVALAFALALIRWFSGPDDSSVQAVGPDIPARPGLDFGHDPRRGPLVECLEQLSRDEESTVTRRIVRKHRLSVDDASDVVRETMLKVCTGHAAKPYDNLGSVLHTSADRRAIDWRRRGRYLTCPSRQEEPTCDPFADQSARFEQEARLVDAALCAEDRNDERIIRQRLMEELDFATIGRDLNLTADQARTRFHNSLIRVKNRVSQACRGPQARPRAPRFDARSENRPRF